MNLSNVSQFSHPFSHSLCEIYSCLCRWKKSFIYCDRGGAKKREFNFMRDTKPNAFRANQIATTPFTYGNYLCVLPTPLPCFLFLGLKLNLQFLWPKPKKLNKITLISGQREIVDIKRVTGSKKKLQIFKAS